jgi:hypothetical protein
MIRCVRLAIVAGVAVTATAMGTAAMAGGDASVSDANTLRERLTGYQEDPLVVSTTGTGQFRASIRGSEVRYRLSYSALESDVTQAHIHFGGAAQSGEISVFLCSNLGNGPVGTQACPPAPATVTGVIRATDVIGPAGQGIGAGEFAELLAAIRAGKTYVNVHSTGYPGGEIRGQLGQDDHH